MKFVAGLDGGGTKTAVTVANEQGLVVKTFVSGAINYNGQDESSIAASLKEIVEQIGQACGGIDNCAQMCIGAAGVSNPTVVNRLTTQIRNSGYQGGLHITGDHETALYGAHERAYGMILIAGTGSIGLGKNKAGMTHRAGGYGHLIDDEGSGYAIGRDLLSAVVQAHDGRIPKTMITDLVYERLQTNSVQDIIGFVYDKRTNKKDIAAIAPMLSDACAADDEAAMYIAEKSAASLVHLVIPVAEALSLQEDCLAITGSVLLKNTFVQSMFREKLHEHYPAMECITPKSDASMGAVLLAWSQLQSQ
ncbi:ATPase [Paenibacillus sp. HJL G12]|uniref:ATPase n=1 Tax=Paenibacillus dendrobii TaxID=2691084 RepID=A0A7X3IGK3_9BACL|nr:BadF/BadG/BcrA/BcrD ATPase family protein [Paenibacillus dendrobii]MWV42090.1 ATPase [Paenibacillus dendrobii]